MYPKFDLYFTSTKIQALTPAGEEFLADSIVTDKGTDSTPTNYEAAVNYGLQISFVNQQVRDWVTTKVRSGFRSAIPA